MANLYKSWWLYGIASLFLTYQMALQVSPGVMANQMMMDLHLDAAALGMMGGSYFWAYTLMQIPAGCFFDQFNTRSILLLAVLLCALATYGFMVYTNLPGLMLMRFIIGGASAFSFTAVLVVAARCFSADRFPLFVGLTQLLAALGGMIGGTPIAYHVEKVGWQDTTLSLSIIGMTIFITIFLCFRSKQFKVKNRLVWLDVWVRLKNIMQKPQTWWIGLYAFFNWGPITLFAALWGEPFFIAKYHMPLTKCSLLIDMVWFGICVAPPIFGWLSSNPRWEKPIMILGASIGALASLLLLYGPELPYTALITLCFLMGVGSSAQILTFAMVKDLHAADHVGTAVGFNNMAVVLGGALLQPFTGYLVKHWSNPSATEAIVYTLQDFNHAMWIVPFCYTACVLLCSQIRFKGDQ